MPSVYQDALARARSGVFRPGPDATYADGDDAAWMGIDWPSLTRRVEVDGRAVSVVDTGGDGPPLLWVHGLGGIWQNWLLNIPAFMDTHRVRGDRPPGLRRVRCARGRDLDRRAGADRGPALRLLEIDEPVVIGNSMGGFVGAELAVSFPTRVSKLVLVAAGGPVDRAPAARAAAGRGAGVRGADGADRPARRRRWSGGGGCGG